MFECSPMRFRSGQIVENLDARNAPVRRAHAASGGGLGAYGDDIHGLPRAG